mgnify:CR=1 FL=1
MRLALAFGEIDVDGFISRIPERVLEIWRRFDCYEPIGGQRIDFNAAMLARQMTKTAGKTFEKVGTVNDFTLEFKPIDHQQSVEDMEAAIMAYTNTVKAMNRRKKPRV